VQEETGETGSGETEQRLHIGWIGLGRVGMQMALRVLSHGYQLTGHSRRFAHHAEIEDHGGVLRSTVVETVQEADIVCVNVFSEDQLRDALVDSGGLAAIPSGGLLAIHSTVRPALILELTSMRDDLDVVDAGFSGTPANASNGTVMLMVGGRPQSVARAEPLFRCYADYIAHLGPSGAGMTLKIINNLLFAAHLSLGAEAIALATRSGITMQDALTTLQRGSAQSLALGTFQGYEDPEVRLSDARRFLEKDVAIGIDAFPELVGIKEANSYFAS
jgi:3-hydroxyisobutyrate dehydrogenase